jgi:diaminobutyrate-2-oxoglutarate transaminase
MKNLFEQHESEVRGYCRNFPAVFTTAKGAWMTDQDGRRYLDFFAGAGVMNYGHNPDKLKTVLIEYLQSDGITHTLDMYSSAKRDFIERFQRVILKPRGLDYKMQFPGPTGTNAVEAALKLARKVTAREQVVNFTNAFHGMTLGALAVTGNGFKRAGAGVPLQHTSSLPFCGYMGDGLDTLDYFEAMLKDNGSGLETPAAVILETVQAEGGVNVASTAWLQRLRKITQEHDIVLIVDDIQVGCGRTGKFFSFEEAGITPDIVTLSKSLSGYGIPMALVLIRPDLDQWAPGEHNGTFRGHAPGFITATKALDYWENNGLEMAVMHKSKIVKERLLAMVERLGVKAEVRGRGLIYGVAFEDITLANQVSQACFDAGMVVETAGMQDQVLKLLPSLTISEEDLTLGLDTIEKSLAMVLQRNAGHGTSHHTAKSAQTIETAKTAETAETAETADIALISA